MKVIAVLWSEEVERDESLGLPDIPPSMFYDMTINYHETERLGGLANYLYKTHHMEVSQALSIPDYMATRLAEGTPMPSFFRFQGLSSFASKSLQLQW
jgi:hypothetical protein